MLYQSKLLELNPQLGLLNDIYQDTSSLYRDTQVPNKLRVEVTDVFNAANDRSLFSLDIEKLLNTEELRIELGTARFSYLQSLNLEGINHALDMSEDFGGVAHYLADKVNTLDSLKVDCDRTWLSTYRCANKPNITHVSQDLDKLQFPTNHYDLIFIGDLDAYKLDKTGLRVLLTKLQSALSINGVLVLNTKNSEHLSKWLDPYEIKSVGTVPYKELYQEQSEQDIDLKGLRESISAAGFQRANFYTTFSKGKRCHNLFSEDYLNNNINAVNHFCRLGAFDNTQVNEYLLFNKLINNKQRVFECGSRFIAFASKSSQNSRRLYNNDFSYFSGRGRQPQWRTITERNCESLSVNKISLYPDHQGDSQAIVADTKRVVVKQSLATQKFQRGRLLLADWLQAVVDNDSVNFAALVHEYYQYLNEYQAQNNFNESAYDLLPFNIIANPGSNKRSFSAIDTEWQIDGELTPDFILFRALFWFAFENKHLLRDLAAKNHLSSISMFVLKYMPNAYQADELNEFIALEEQIQSQISSHFNAKSVEYALLQTFDSEAKISQPDPMATFLWGNSQGSMDDASALVSVWQGLPERQIVNSSLPSFDASRKVLRVDPIDTKSLFSFTSIKIFDKEKKVIWQLNSADQINTFAQQVNVMPINRQTDGSNSSETVFVALNNDPRFSFDLSDVEKLEMATSIELELALLHDANYEAALDVLSDAVLKKDTLLEQQANNLNLYQSELEHTNLRLEDTISQRNDVNHVLNSKRQHIKNLNNQIVEHLKITQDLQKLNHDLQALLIMRPTTRAKRFAARMVRRLMGKPLTVETNNIEAEAVEAPFDPNVLPTSGELLGQNLQDYQLWVQQHSLSDDDIEQAKKDIEAMDYQPTFSILVPVYNVDAEYLIAMIRSVQAQIYPHWQLCIVDDASPKTYLKQILEHEAKNDSRISILLNDQNQGISVATNDAISLATGDYIGLLDHDDEISIDALYENAKVINQYPDAGLIYSDEDKMDMQGKRLEPFFKPDYSPDLLDTNNYVCHFTVIQKAIVDEIGGFREGLDGSQDHDIILRAIEQSKRVVHIPKILYHWRKIPGSTAVAYDSKSYAWEAGRKAVEDRLKKKERGVHVEFGSLKGTYRVFRDIHDDPLVSIIIPFKDKPELLNSCLDSILNLSTYTNFEIVGVSNNSEDQTTFDRMKHYAELDERIRFVEKNIPFNFSAICNYGVEQAKGDYVLLLNNDIEIRSPDWIERLLEHAQRPEIGAVGGKLLYPDGRIQHAGVVAGMVGAAGHPHKYFPDNHIGYHGRLHMVYNVSAVTGAMLLVKTAKYKEVGGLDEDNLAVAYNDIDLCLKLLSKGYYNVFTPHCTAIHHESISRGYEDTDEKLQRLKREQSHFLTTWKDFLDKGDPYYNPNLSLKNEHFSLQYRD